MTERELIRDIRAELVRSCNCVEVCVDRNSEVCGSCLLVGMIDDGLGEIGKDRDKVLRGDECLEIKPVSVKKLKQLAVEASRAGNITDAVKLYNQASEKEQVNG